MGKNNVGAALSFLISLGFMAMLATLMFTVVPPENKEYFFTGFGIMGSLQTMVIQYWIGSSKGSADKTEATNAAAQAKASLTTP